MRIFSKEIFLLKANKNRVLKIYSNRNASIFYFILPVFLFFQIVSFGQSDSSQKWVGTWSTAPQLVETYNNPPEPGLSNNTIRQIVHVSLGGDSLRMRFSNEFSTKSVTMKSVHIAVSNGGSLIDTTTDRTLYFNGEPEVAMQAGSAVTSDPFYFELDPLTDIAITIHFGETSSDVTGHPGSRTTSYILTGNEVTKVDFAGAVTTDHWYVINTIDVLAPDSAAAVAILGNSITDGRGSGTNKQNRWPDELARRLQANPITRDVAVLNVGIGGNCVLGNCLGPSALSRFQRDVVNQSGVKWVIIFEGINDIGYAWSTDLADDLIDGYRQMINIAHSNGIFAYGATLLPIKGSSYYSEDHETIRNRVNEWIRNSGEFDAVIDLDKALRNPEDTLSLLPDADTGDHLHPNENGHRMMAEAVDLNLFTGNDTLDYSDSSWSIYYEAECAAVGESWEIFNDTQASNGKYVTVESGTESLSEPPRSSEGLITIPFSIDSSGTFSLFARLDCPTYDDDSYWIKVDDEEFAMFNGLVTSGWEWKNIGEYNFTAGEHKLIIAYREDGAKLDKICITNSIYAPIGMGEDAGNLCEDPTEVGIINKQKKDFLLGQNYPNPFNPSTNIEYYIPTTSKVTLTIFDTLGREVENIVDEVKSAGHYKIKFSRQNLSSGIYFYQMQAGSFFETKKFIIQK